MNSLMVKLNSVIVLLEIDKEIVDDPDKSDFEKNDVWEKEEKRKKHKKERRE